MTGLFHTSAGFVSSRPGNIKSTPTATVLLIGLQDFPEREAMVLRSMLRLIAAPLERQVLLVEPAEAEILLIATDTPVSDLGALDSGVKGSPASSVRIIHRASQTSADQLTQANPDWTAWPHLLGTQGAQEALLPRPIRVQALQTILHAIIHGLELPRLAPLTLTPSEAVSVQGPAQLTNTRAAAMLGIFLRPNGFRVRISDGPTQLWLNSTRGSVASSQVQHQLLPWLLSPVSDRFQVDDWPPDQVITDNLKHRIRLSWLRWHAAYFGVKAGWVDSRLQFQPLRLRRKPNFQQLAHGQDHRELADLLYTQRIPLSVLQRQSDLTEQRIAPFLNACFLCGYLDFSADRSSSTASRKR
ncbi:hypothetical protein DU000_11345 [Parvibium lacunae]|uniref:Uncharacterized protein n=2 Tax=Parvibium lacunae TaxID=1888893 RepID=A0A368KZK4_9BURK|nr:hypothetical protein DU000_11345 [Parvibium lacunae]